MSTALRLAPVWPGGLIEPAPISDRELAAVIDLVYRKSGITLHDGKRALVTARLQKRLKALGVRSYSDYLAALERDVEGGELVMLLDAITTNHTSFFREPQHFDLLRQKVVPDVLARGLPTVDVWSAACSSGEEPYTLAMVLDEAMAGARAPGVRILASDLSTKVLAAATRGIYKLERVRDIPQPLLRKYFEKGAGAQEGLARVRSAIRQRVRFEQRNLLEIGDLGTRFAVIFCRNVMIYFDRPVQQRVVSMLQRHLRPGGYLFISHSESLNGITHDLRWVAPAVYKRRDP